jgi:hypothetical protein
MGLISVLAWTAAAAVTRHNADAETARWQSWWTSACGSQSPHRLVVAGRVVCQVPLEDKAAK